MKLTLEPTREIRTVDGAPHRIWRGQDEHGTPVLAAIRFVQPQTHDEALLAPFDHYLSEIDRPHQSETAPGPFDVRPVL